LLDPLPKHLGDRVCSAKRGTENPSRQKHLYSVDEVAFFLLSVKKSTYRAHWRLRSTELFPERVPQGTTSRGHGQQAVLPAG
jgi:hypothetical protein